MEELNKVNESKINPEIKEKAEELFNLLEEEIANNHWDSTCEAISEEMGDFLRASKGLEALEFSHLLSKPQSEQAIMYLEESTWYMDEETLSLYYDLAYNANEIIKIFEADEIDGHRLSIRIRDLKDCAPKILNYIQYEYTSRSRGYRKEISRLKDKSKTNNQKEALKNLTHEELFSRLKRSLLQLAEDDPDRCVQILHSLVTDKS